jgi:hypothetical protein
VASAGRHTISGFKSAPVTPSGYRLAVKNPTWGAARVKPSTDDKLIDKSECRSR